MAKNILSYITSDYHKIRNKEIPRYLRLSCSEKRTK